MLEIFLEYRDDGQRIASVILALAMWRWGSVPERLVSWSFVVLFTIPTTALEYVFQRSIVFVEGGVYYTVMDMIALAVFVAVALNANRNYTLWIAGFQIIAVVSHFVRYVTEVVTPIAHAVMVIGPGYFQLILMLVGLIRHVRRKEKHGKYRDWRMGFSPPFVKKTVPDGLERQL